MKELNTIFVEETPQKFYISTNFGWEDVVGHKLVVNGYHFFVAPIDGDLRVSELESGSLVYKEKMDWRQKLFESKEGTLLYISVHVANQVINIIEEYNKKTGDFDNCIKEKIDSVIGMFGENPKNKVNS